MFRSKLQNEVAVPKYNCALVGLGLLQVLIPTPINSDARP